MKHVIGAMATAAAMLLAGEALAQGPMYGGGWMGGQGTGPGPMGPGFMGGRRAMMMGGAGPQACPMAQAAQSTAAEPDAVSEAQARELAQKYADQYLKGFSVERVLPFTGRRGFTAYSVELTGPDGQSRVLHINPWGGVMPFGGPGRRAS